MDGSIELASTFGEGTTMVVRIPFRKAPSHSPQRSDTPDLDSLTVQARKAKRELGVKVLLAEGEFRVAPRPRKGNRFDRSRFLQTIHSCEKSSRGFLSDGGEPSRFIFGDLGV